MGLTNKSIENALLDLIDKSPEETTVAFVATASNMITGDKTWIIDALARLKNLNFKSIEITDISAVGKEIWQPSFEKADVIYFEGGHTYHLMRWLHKTGLSESMAALLKNKVYLGVSAGAMVTNPNLNPKLSNLVYHEEKIEYEKMDGMNLVDFHFLPHLNTPWYEKMTKENIEQLSKQTHRKIYGLDNQSALKIVGDKIEVITEGEFCLFND
jgi:dipeptidase E